MWEMFSCRRWGVRCRGKSTFYISKTNHDGTKKKYQRSHNLFLPSQILAILGHFAIPMAAHFEREPEVRSVSRVFEHRQTPLLSFSS